MNRSIKLKMWDNEKQLFIPMLSLALPNETTPLVQYTGVIDATGKEIWEGDIVRWSWNDELTHQYYERHFEVVFRHGCFGTIGQDESDEFTPYEKDQSKDTVVGHVFKHAHLLNISTVLPW